MGRVAVAFLYFILSGASIACGQNTSIQPVHAPAGAVLSFHLQNLLRPASGDPVVTLPEGTLLQVRLLDSIDSRVNHDGDVFRGTVVASVRSGDTVIIQSGASVQGLLVLLRSRKHPEGFRYELLVTAVTSLGKTYALTASLDSSLFDSAAHPSAALPSAPRGAPVEVARPAAKSSTKIY